MTQQLEEQEIIKPAQDQLEVIRVEFSPRWVRAYFGGQPIANSKRVLLVFEPRRLPVYYFPIADVQMDLLRASDYSASTAGAGSDRTRWTLEKDGRTVTNVAWSYRQPALDQAPLKDHIAFCWDKQGAPGTRGGRHEYRSKRQ